MTWLLENLLDLEGIRLGSDAPLTFEWHHAIPPWLLFIGAILVLGAVVWAYRREPVSTPRRVALATTRCAIAALLIAVICQPALVLQRNRVERSYVVLAVDRSASMDATDVYRDDELAAAVARGTGITDRDALSNLTRLSAAQAALTRDDRAALTALLERNGVQLCTFAGTTQTEGLFNPGTAEAEHAADLAAAINGIQPDGRVTDLAGGISGAMQAAQGRRLAAIILVSDGQATQPTSIKDALDRVRDRRIPVFALRVGSPLRPLDIEVGPLWSQEIVFVNDVLAIEAQIIAAGLEKPTPVTIRLTDDADEVVAEEQLTLLPDDPTTVVELRTVPRQPGMHRYTATVTPLAGERTTDNNADHVDVTVLDKDLRILYVEGYPRYEYRYLKNALLREENVTLSVLLLDADERFVQEGTQPIRRFPQTPEELNRYDALVFGDVDPRGGWLSEAQMRMVLDYVGNRGGGFGLIAGERFAPHRFLDTPLERLIPVRIDPSFFGRYETTLTDGFNAVLTPEGKRSPILRFTADREKNASIFARLPDLFWYARTLGPRPGATVLIEHPAQRTTYGMMPLVVVGRYGAGRLFFQATDDTWRWRRHTGELLHDAYWVRVVRSLASRPQLAQDRSVVLRTNRRVFNYGEPVEARVEFFDPHLLATQGEAITVAVDEGTAATAHGLATLPRPVLDRFELHRTGPESGRFEGAWTPPAPGRFNLRAELDLGADTPAPSAMISVTAPDLEARRPETNHEALERIAAVTGGRVLALDEVTTGFSEIRDRSVRVPDDVVEPLWDSKLVLLLFVGMISVEWIMRKAFGLL